MPLYFHEFTFKRVNTPSQTYDDFPQLFLVAYVKEFFYGKPDFQFPPDIWDELNLYSCDTLEKQKCFIAFNIVQTMINKNYWTLSYEDACFLCSFIDFELVSPTEDCKEAAAAITANIKQAMNVGINTFEYAKRGGVYSSNCPNLYYYAPYIVKVASKSTTLLEYDDFKSVAEGRSINSSTPSEGCCNIQ